MSSGRHQPAGEDVIDVFNNFTFNKGESSEGYGTVLQNFDNHWVAQSNEAYERHIFRKRIQAAGQTFEQFPRDAKKQARLCNGGIYDL